MHLKEQNAGHSAKSSFGEEELLGRFRKVVVLGANGTMGYGSGGLFAAAGSEVVFLARSTKKAEQGLAEARRHLDEAAAQNIKCGNYEADLEREVRSADFVFEALSEQLELKQEFFRRIDGYCHKDMIVGSVTSGLSINGLVSGLSEGFKRRFLGVHFFNPPHLIRGTELIPSEFTDPRVLDLVQAYAEQYLGREVIRASDKPGFAGNRLGFQFLNRAAQLAEAYGPALVDHLLGAYTGRGLSPLSTVDLVGWDVHQAIVDNIYGNTQDEAHASFKLPGYMARMIPQGTLGRKTNGGFYRRGPEKQRLVLDIATGAYEPLKVAAAPELEFIEPIRELQARGEFAAAALRFVRSEGELAELAQRVVAEYVSSGLHRVGDCVESVSCMDKIMAFGFNWAPPGLWVDLLGPEVTLQWFERVGVPAPEVLKGAQVAEGFTRGARFTAAQFFGHSSK